jgi:hypothetical protein
MDDEPRVPIPGSERDPLPYVEAAWPCSAWTTGRGPGPG